MTKGVNVPEAKTRLSGLLDDVHEKVRTVLGCAELPVKLVFLTTENGVTTPQAFLNKDKKTNKQPSEKHSRTEKLYSLNTMKGCA